MNTMIVLETLKLDPRLLSFEEIQTEVLKYKESGQNKVTVEWFDLSMDQEEALDKYLPIVKYAQSLNLNVYCVMSQRMSESLVRYKKLMFVDPLFLLKFKFKEISFTIPYYRPDLMR